MSPSRLSRLRRAGFEDYADYLRSSHWLRLKARYKRSRPWACVCGETKRLELHHKTYERIGAERLTDLQPLCQTCHSTVHQLEREGQGSLDPARMFFAGRAEVYACTRTDRYPDKKPDPGCDNAYRKVTPTKPPKMTQYERDVIARVVETGSL